jgi:NAD(P)H-nitrite reductase large subunit
MKDPGFFGTDEGFTAVAGGKGGGTARIGRELATGLAEGQAVGLARNVIAFYRENPKPPERLGETIERAGFDTFVKAGT